MEDMSNTSQWAILPGPVRYDRNIPANAKLLFAEIAAKTITTGYCWASNEFFAQHMGLSADSISRLIKVLEDAEYIVVSVEPTAANDRRREIYTTPKGWGLGGIGKNAETRSRQKCRYRPGKNAGGHLIKENDKENKPLADRPKYLPLDVFTAMTEYAGADGPLLLALLGWAEMRQRIHKPVATAETVRRACRQLDKHSEGDRAYKLGEIKKATDCNWLSFYPLKEGDEGYHAPLDQQIRDPLGGLDLL